MASVLYEHVVDASAVSGVSDMIRLSEHLRSGRKLEYADGVEELLETLRRPGVRLRQQPNFEWEGMQSPCFRFELHRALTEVHDDHERRADVLFGNGEFKEAASAFMAAVRVARRLVGNLKAWTAISPELRRAPPFHVEFLLSLMARAKCRAHHAMFVKLYEDETSGISWWKHGDVKPHQITALQHIEASCRYCTAATLLWARPGGPRGMTTEPAAFERELRQLYHRTASYCATTFQDRLDHAAACEGSFLDCAAVVELNTRLYFLKAQPCLPPRPMDLKHILKV